mmetsp:Transcript_38687/g.37033  ORF Transcript_38687/g.37033 Transcript_38687/m.37033 type:complete len:87 (+) Transcript_38687:686-946(+)
MKMFFVRICSAVGIIFLLYQFSLETENIDGLTNFTSDNLNDLFDWGHDRFVMGKIADKSGNAKKKKSNYEIFMEAIMEGEEEEKQA